MTTEISKQPGLPPYRYSRHVDAVLACRRRFENTREAMATRSPDVLGQNRHGTSYGQCFRSLEYRRRVRLGVGQDPRQGLLRVALCALLVWALCAWMFWNANFATP